MTVDSVTLSGKGSISGGKTTPRGSGLGLPLAVGLLLTAAVLALWSALRSEASAAGIHSHLPELGLAGGLLLAWGLALTAGLARSGRGAVEAALREQISELQRAEQALRESEASIRSLYNIASSSKMGFAEKAQALLELGCQRFGTDSGVLSRVEGESFELVAIRSPDNTCAKGAVFPLAQTWSAETVAAQGPVAFEHAGATHRRDHPAYAALKLESYIGAPVSVSGRLFGTLGFASGTPRATPFKPADLEFLKVMALWIGGELERQQRDGEALLLSELGSLLQTCDSLDEAFQVIARQARKLFPDLSGAVYLISASRADLERVASWGEGDDPDEARLEPGEIFRREDCWALRLGRDHFVENPTTDLLCRHATGDAPPRSSFCVPMLALGEALGVFHLYRRGEDRPQNGLSEARRRLVITVAEHIAMALANLNLRETLRNQSIRDSLTGLHNRRYFESSLEREVRRAKRRGTPLGVLLLDLDHFKLFNDAFGHEAGDILLKALADSFRRRVRGQDVVCRYGGEEFALLLPDAPLEVLRVRAESLRRDVQEMQVLYDDTPLGPVTVSVGVAVFPEHGTTGEDLVRAADAALYQSKAAGRDRVTIAPAATIDRRLMLPE